MNFQQLRSVREAVRCGFNLTEVAALLYTSQPGVSRQIRELEEELGVEIFVRAGKRLTGLTPPGQAVLPIVERLLQDADNLKRAGQDYSSSHEGRLSIAATHSQARYALPHVVRDFRAMFPQVSLHLHQGSPKQVAEMLLSGEADIGVATEALSHYDALVTLPCYRWTHSIVVPPGHPLLALQEPVTLQQLQEFPIITYELGYTGRSHIDEAFAREGLKPEVAFMKAGRVKALGITSAKRMPFAPDLPALTETPALASYTLENWFGLFAPAATPEPVVRKLSEAVAAALKDPAMQARLREQGAEPAPMEPAAFRDFVRSESAKFAKIVEAAGVTPDN